MLKINSAKVRGIFFIHGPKNRKWSRRPDRKRFKIVIRNACHLSDVSQNQSFEIKPIHKCVHGRMKRSDSSRISFTR